MKLIPEKIMWKSGIASAFLAAIMAPTMLETREEFVERVSHSYTQDVAAAQTKFDALTSGSEKLRIDYECNKTANSGGLTGSILIKDGGGRKEFLNRCIENKTSQETNEAGFWLSAYKARQDNLLENPAEEHGRTATFARTVGGVAGGIAFFCLGAPALRRRRSGNAAGGPSPTV